MKGGGDILILEGIMSAWHWFTCFSVCYLVNQLMDFEQTNTDTMFGGGMS